MQVYWLAETYTCYLRNGKAHFRLGADLKTSRHPLSQHWVPDLQSRISETKRCPDELKRGGF